MVDVWIPSPLKISGLPLGFHLNDLGIPGQDLPCQISQHFGYGSPVSFFLQIRHVSPRYFRRRGLDAPARRQPLGQRFERQRHH